MALSFSNFDSADFATIDESIVHSQSNPFLAGNYSDRLIATVDGANVIVHEPFNVLKSFAWMLDDLAVTYDMPQDEYYMPERTARRVYGSHDFWYVCMLVNNCSTVKDYRYTRYKVIPVESLYHVETFLDKARRSARVYSPDSNTIYK